MRVIIEYEASWRNSFLEGDNNEPLPKSGRKFIGSMTSLKKQENYRSREVTLDTVMGVLNRLIGDQRKLYQSRQCDNYYFRDIEGCVTFTDEPKVISDEMVYIRNITGSTDQNSYTGMIKVSDPIFQSDYSQEFWGVLGLDLSGLCQFILNEKKVDIPVIGMEPLSLMTRLEEINKFKSIAKEGRCQAAYDVLAGQFAKFKGLNSKGLILPVSLYCSALYLQLERLSNKYDMSSAKTKAGGISGISNNGFTKKDFMSRYTTGEKKKIWGNPYLREEFIKGEGKLQKRMQKASGELCIELDIDRKRGKEIDLMIKNAGVSSFYLGKKGIAYVTKIRV